MCTFDLSRDFCFRVFEEMVSKFKFSAFEWVRLRYGGPGLDKEIQ